MSYYREQLNSWLANIEVSADNVLDVGGGQDPVSKKLKSYAATNYKILDNDAQFKPDIFHDLNYTFPISNHWGAYNVVFCLEVMEYIWNPLEAHLNLCNFLAPEGVAYISYPTIYPLHNPPGIDYLRYTKNGIEKLLRESGFETWEIQPRMATKGIKNLANFYLNEGMRAMKNTEDIYHIGYMVKAYKKGVQV